MPRVQIIEKSCHREGLKVQRLRRFFEGNGYIVSRPHHELDPTNKYAFPLEKLSIDPDADLFVLTTCGFTQAIEDGDFSALEMIRKNKREDARIIMGGCLTKINPERVKEEFGGDTFDMDDYGKINKLVGAQRPLESFAEPTSMPNTDRFFVTIQEGCNNRCSFCSIWKTGASRSRSMENILERIHEGLKLGHHRIYLIGENAGSWGLDLQPRKHLGDLLHELTKIDQDFKVVLEDVNPMYLRKNFEPLLELCRQNKVELFHSPVQSGSPRILRLMRRMYKIDPFLSMIRQLREASDELIMSSAIIVGFPSETREELELSINFCDAAGYDTVACHMYSQRPGNPSNEMDNQIDEKEKIWRYNHFRDSFTGRTRVDPNQRPLVDMGLERGVSDADILAAMSPPKPPPSHTSGKNAAQPIVWASKERSEEG